MKSHDAQVLRCQSIQDPPLPPACLPPNLLPVAHPSPPNLELSGDEGGSGVELLHQLSIDMPQDVAVIVIWLVCILKAGAIFVFVLYPGYLNLKHLYEMIPHNGLIILNKILNIQLNV